MKSVYNYQRETRGYSVWSRDPETGANPLRIAVVRDERDAQRMIAKLNREPAEAGRAR